MTGVAPSEGRTGSPPAKSYLNRKSLERDVMLRWGKQIRQATEALGSPAEPASAHTMTSPRSASAAHRPR